MATNATGATGLAPCPLCGKSGNVHVAEVTRTYGGGGTRYAAACSNRACRLSAVPRWDQCMESEDDPLAEERLGTWATGCGEALTWNAENDGCGEPPAFCPYCGGAVKEVD